MGICEKINQLVVCFTILTASLWFLLVIQLPHSRLGYSQQSDKLQNVKSRVELLTVPLHKTTENYDSLQLIEVINKSQPYNNGEEAILMVTSEWWGRDYQNLMQLLSNSRSTEDFQVPLYILKQTKNHNYYNHRHLGLHGLGMLHQFKNYMQTPTVKRLSIIAYQEGALLTLLALSFTTPAILKNVDKVILINPFNPDHQYFQNDPKSLAKMIKRNILSDPVFTNIFQKLRIVIINTFRTIYPEQTEVRQYFNFAFQHSSGLYYQLNSTLALSSKALWNIHSTLQNHQYFRHEHFLNLLLRLFLEDYKHKLSIKQIEYLLRYRQLGQPKLMSQSTRKRYLADCHQLHLQTLSLEMSSIRLFKDCTCITIRQRYEYNQAILVLYSQIRFDVYSQQYYKILPYSSKQNQYIYVISNLVDLHELIIINPSRKGIGFKITSLYNIQANPIDYFSQEVDHHKTIMIQDQDSILAVPSCEGWLALFGLGENKNYKQIMQWQEGNCFIQLQERHIHRPWFRYNWNVIRNTIIFTLFCTHVINKLTFNRFYTQLALNLIVLTYTLNHLYMFENMIITSTCTAIEIISRVINKVSAFAQRGRYMWTIILFPTFCQFVARQFGEPNYFNLQKLLWVQVVCISSQSGFLITMIKCYFMHDLYATDNLSIYSLLLLALWQIINLQKFRLYRNNPLSLSKRRMTDVIFLFMLCINLTEEASVIHQLINFYIITHILLAAGETTNLIIDRI